MLRAEAVSFAFPQAGHGLAPVSLQVEPAQTLFIRGSSGCGKSTLARCLSGLIPHLYHGEYGGQVWLDGLRADQAPLWALSEKVGLVFQNPAAQMLAATVEEEILFGLENLGIGQNEAQERLEAGATQLRVRGTAPALAADVIGRRTAKAGAGRADCPATALPGARRAVVDAGYQRRA